MAHTMTEHSIFEPGNLLAAQERERMLSRVLRRQGIESLADLRIIAAGPETPRDLRLLVQWGAAPANITGVRFPASKSLAEASPPGIGIFPLEDDAIPDGDETVDLLLAFGLFGGLGNEDTAHGIARELFRVTKPGGLILIYDTRGNSLGDRRDRAIRFDDVRRWFPKCPAREQSLTLAAPVASLTGRFAPWLYGPLSALPALRTHALYVLRRPALPPIRADYTPPGFAPSE